MLLLISCDSENQPLGESGIPLNEGYDWIVPTGDITGSGNPFSLLDRPVLFPVSEIDFIDDEALTAVVSMHGQLKAYPYAYVSKFEAVNDLMETDSYTLTYCPITKSTVVMNRKFRNTEFLFRASGYLFGDNLILVDQASQTYWSQMLVQCIKGPNAEEYNATFPFVEMPWKTVRKNFPDALVFTSGSADAVGNKSNVKEGDLVYGIIGREIGKTSQAHIFSYPDFDGVTKLYRITVSGKRTLVIGNEKYHYITSYYIDSNAEFEAIQDQFPIVMKDSDNNLWNVFGEAVSGPRLGERLEAPLAYFALFWAWENFYGDIVLNE